MPKSTKAKVLRKTARFTAKQVAFLEAEAKARGRSFSWMVQRAMMRDLGRLPAGDRSPIAEALPSITTPKVAALLRCSSRTVVRRANTPGDPLHAARVSAPGKKPFGFDRAKVEALEA